MSNSNGIYAIGGFMLGLAVAGVWHLGNYLPALPTLPTTASASSTNQLPPESDAVSVSNQRAGEVVLINSVTVPPPGVWVAVQDLNEDETLGNVLGASRVRGPASALTVALLRPTLRAQRYAVTLYRDDGDGSFDRASDSAYIDFDTGARVETLFTAE